MPAGNRLGVQAASPTTVLTLDAGTLQITSATGNALATNRRVQVNAAGGSIADIGSNNFYQSDIINNAGAASSLYLSNISGTTQFQGAISGTGGVTWIARAPPVSRGRTRTVAARRSNPEPWPLRRTALGSGTLTINDNATLANNDTVAHTLANAITLSGAAAGETFAGSQNLTLNGTLSSTAAVKVSKTGSSVLTLSADNSGTLAANSTWTVSGGNYNSTTGLYDNVVALNSGRAWGARRVTC